MHSERCKGLNQYDHNLSFFPLKTPTQEKLKKFSLSNDRRSSNILMPLPIMAANLSLGMNSSALTGKWRMQAHSRLANWYFVITLPEQCPITAFSQSKIIYLTFPWCVLLASRSWNQSGARFRDETSIMLQPVSVLIIPSKLAQTEILILLRSIL